MFDQFKHKVKESFSRSAATYDHQPDLHDFIIEKVLSKLQGEYKYILDIGCGTGKLVTHLAKRYPAAKIIGLDIAPGMVVRGKEKTKGLGLGNVRFIEGDGEALPFQPAQFDLIVSTASMQWMSAGKMMEEAARVLKPEGEFIFATFGPQTLAEQKRGGLSINFFLDADRLRNLAAKFWLTCHFEQIEYKLEFANIFDLVAYLKRVGANVPDMPKEKRLTRGELFSTFPPEKKLEALFEIIILSSSCW